VRLRNKLTLCSVGMQSVFDFPALQRGMHGLCGGGDAQAQSGAAQVVFDGARRYIEDGGYFRLPTAAGNPLQHFAFAQGEARWVLAFRMFKQALGFAKGYV